MYSAGIVGQVGKTTKPYPVHTTSNVKLKNCVNNGNLTADASYCAGMVAYSYGHLEIIGCVNNGPVTNTVAAGSRAAGIFGSPTSRDNYSSVVIDGCVNNATISGSFHAAGIAAYLGNATPEDAANGYGYKLRNCENHGNIILDGEARSTSSNMRAAGIAAYAYGGSYNCVENCINTGNIFADIAHVTDKAAHISGVLGYVKNANFNFKNNINTGIITIEGLDTAKTAPSLSMLCYNNIASVGDNTANNYTVNALEGAPIFRLASGAALEDETKAKVVTAEQVASGEMVYNLNEKAGATIYYQDLKTGKITLTAAEDGSNVVIKNADGTYSNPVKEPEVTEPEVTTPEVTEPEVTTPEVTEPEVTEPVGPNPPTSDNGIAVIIAACALLSVACAVSLVVIKKKEN